MKALSVRQPWAWAICSGLKDVENRTWRTDYRGRFLVHASRAWAHEGERFLRQHGLPVPRDLPRGAIVGSVCLVDCVRGHPSLWSIDGQWQFVLAEPEGLPPQPCAGRLGFFAPQVTAPRRPRPHQSRTDLA